jgi:hypothetical protein
MKSLVITLLALPMIAFGQEVMLDKKTVDLGALNQETNAAANELVVIKRTAKTPTKVVLKFKMNYMEKKCVEYETNQEDIPEFTQTVCTPALAGQHDCEEKIYAGLFNAKTVCVKDGLVRKALSGEVKLDFGGAVKLSPAATETFKINIKQGSIFKDNISLAGKAIDTASLYTIKEGAFGDTLKFKAK